MTGTPLVVIISVGVIFINHLLSAGSENTDNLQHKLLVQEALAAPEQRLPGGNCV